MFLKAERNIRLPKNLLLSHTVMPTSCKYSDISLMTTKLYLFHSAVLTHTDLISKKIFKLCSNPSRPIPLSFQSPSRNEIPTLDRRSLQQQSQPASSTYLCNTKRLVDVNSKHDGVGAEFNAVYFFHHLLLGIEDVNVSNRPEHLFTHDFGIFRGFQRRQLV
jgi:hypothetical protein